MACATEADRVQHPATARHYSSLIPDLRMTGPQIPSSD